MAARATSVAVAAAYVGLFAALSYPLYANLVFTQGDLSWFHLPARYLYQSAVQHGDSILWTPALWSGFPLHGEGQVGAFHPLHLVLYRFFSLTSAFNLESIASYLFAAAGMFLLLRYWSFDRTVAAFGGAAFAFSAFNVVRFNHMNAVAVVAHLPWNILFLEVAAAATGWKRSWAFVALSCGLASQLFLGYPQYVVITGIATIIAAVCRHHWRTSASAVLMLAAAVLVATLLGAVQLLPTRALSQRSSRPPSTDESRSFLSLHPLDLSQFVLPSGLSSTTWDVNERAMPHEFSLYDGAFATLAVAWVIGRWRALRHRRRIVALALMLAGAGLVLALGRYAGVYPLIAHLPVLSQFRGPSRHIPIVHVALAILSACALDDLRHGPRPSSRFWWTPPILVAATAVVLAWMSLAQDSRYWPAILGLEPATQIVLGASVFVATGALLLLAAHGVRGAIPLLVILAFVDLGCWGFGYVWLKPPRAVGYIRRSADPPPGEKRGTYVYVPIGVPWDNRLVLSGLRLTTGYAGLAPARVLAAHEVRTHRLAGARWARPAGEWVKVEDPMPRVRLVSEARVSAQPAADVHAIDIASTALVGVALDGLSGVPGEAAVISDRPGELVVEVDAPGRQLLVTTEAFDAGWVITSAGRSLPAIPVYGDFLGCVVDPGARTVTLTYAPATVRQGAWLGAVGLIALAAAAYAAARWQM